VSFEFARCPVCGSEGEWDDAGPYCVGQAHEPTAMLRVGGPSPVGSGQERLQSVFPEMPARFVELVGYNQRRVQGIAHAPVYEARMAGLQAEFDVWYRAYVAAGCGAIGAAKFVQGKPRS